MDSGDVLHCIRLAIATARSRIEQLEQDGAQGEIKKRLLKIERANLSNLLAKRDAIIENRSTGSKNKQSG